MKCACNSNLVKEIEKSQVIEVFKLQYICRVCSSSSEFSKHVPDKMRFTTWAKKRFKEIEKQYKEMMKG